MLLRRMNGKFHHITVIALYQQLCLKQYETYAAFFVLFGAKRKQGQKTTSTFIKIISISSAPFPRAIHVSMVEREHFDPTLQASMQKRQRAATSQQSAIEHVKVEERERRTPATTSTISVPLNTAVL